MTLAERIRRARGRRCSECCAKLPGQATGRPRLTCRAKCGRIRTRRLARERAHEEQVLDAMLVGYSSGVLARELLEVPHAA